MHRPFTLRDTEIATSESPSNGTLCHLRYGNIAYNVLQDIELAVIAMKEVKYMLADHFRCYFGETTTIGDQILEFSTTQYHSDVVESDAKDKICQVLKSLLYERNKIVHEEGYDVLSDRQRFINQSMEAFISLSPSKNGVRVSPARYSVLYPCPDVEAALEVIANSSCVMITLSWGRGFGGGL